MNLLWLTAIYPSLNSPAEGVFHQTQAEALAAQGIKIQVVAPVPWIPKLFGRIRRQWNSYGYYPSRYEVNGVEVFRPRFLAHPRHFFYGIPHRFMASAAKRLGLPKPDLIHAHIAFPCGLAARLISEQIGVPYVLTLHGSDVHSYPTINTQCKRRFLHAVQGAAKVMAVGEGLAKTARDISGIDPVVHPIGINIDKFQKLPDRQESRRSLNIPQDEYVVLYVGRLVAAKGIRELLHALEKDFPRKVSGLFAGDGPLYGQATAHPKVRALGAIANNQLPACLAAADTLILPSYKEGLPTVLVEAGAAGLPVIATRIPGVLDLAGEDGAHLIEPGSIELIAAGIRRLMSDECYAASLALKMRQRVEQNYDAHKNASKVIGVYQQVADKNAWRAAA